MAFPDVCKVPAPPAPPVPTPFPNFAMLNQATRLVAEMAATENGSNVPSVIVSDAETAAR